MAKAKKEPTEDGVANNKPAHGADNDEALKVLEKEAKEEDNA